MVVQVFVPDPRQFPRTIASTPAPPCTKFINARLTHGCCRFDHCEIGILHLRLLSGILFILSLALPGTAQAPSTEEQQYFFSVLPLIERGDLTKAEEQILAGLQRYT